MRIEPANCVEFLEVIGTAARSQCADTVAALAMERWTPQQLSELVYNCNPEVRKLACHVLGLVGDQRAMPALATGLCDLDPHVHAFAENAAWSIWFRSGACDAQHDFARGMQAMAEEDPQKALHHFRKACAIDPQFAEAYNQCGLAHYMLEQWVEATAPCRRAIKLQPWHFGAFAGLGHCFAHTGDLDQAACCYRSALAINPRMEGVSTTLGRIEQCLGVSSGDPESTQPWPPPPPQD
ncbi:MAG: tetratricopeptide repeat protein [Phycisphaeraceae bacterium]